MAQNDFGTIDPATTSGTDLATLLGEFRDAQNTLHSGSTRPTYATAGMLWIQDVSATVKRLNVFDGSDDLEIGTYDTTTNVWTPVVASGVAYTASNLTVTGHVNFGGNINSIVTGTVNNSNPTGLDSAFRINYTSTTTARITGITAPLTDGRLILVTTTTGGITLAHDDSGSLANARIEISGGRDLFLNRGDSVLLQWELSDANWRTIALLRSSSFPAGHINGLEISNNAADLDHDITLAAGSCRSDDNTADIVVSADIVGVPMDTTFSDVNGGGLRATETLPLNGTVHMFVIDNPDSDSITPKLLGSASINPPLPAGYSIKRRVGSVRTDGANNIIRFRQTGDYFYLNPFVIDVSTVSFPTSAFQALTVPTGIQVQAIVQINLDASSFNIGTAANIQEIGTPSPPAPSSIGGGAVITVANGFAASVVPIVTRASAGDVLVRVSQNNANLRVSIATLGWRDLTR